MAHFRIRQICTLYFSEVSKWVILLVLQERVWEDVAVATSFRQADRSWARLFAVASPRFIGCRSASTVLSQDCLGRPSSVSMVGPQCRPGELGDDPVRGLHGRVIVMWHNYHKIWGSRSRPTFQDSSWSKHMYITFASTSSAIKGNLVLSLFIDRRCNTMCLWPSNVCVYTGCIYILCVQHQTRWLVKA